MSRQRAKDKGKPALEILEEAVHLLRLAPPSVLISYCIGTMPFLLGLLYFWTDMSRSPFASHHVASASLGMAVLFVWMKCWQTIFARQLRARLCGEPSPRWDARQISRMAAFQTFVQPTEFVLLPVALVVALPFGWVYAFYHNLTVLGAEEDESFRATFERVKKQTKLWPGQNHTLLCLLWLFGAMVFLNIVIGLLVIPELMRMLLGVETMFSRSGLAMLNTTFFAVCFGLTYLFVNPIAKAAYTLRCFYGESLSTGEDFRVELKRARLAQTLAIVALLGSLIFSVATPSARAETPTNEASQNTPPRTAPDVISQGEMKRSMEEVMQRREYVWRLPRESVAPREKEKTWLASVLESIGDMMRKFARWLARLLRLGGSGPTTPNVGFMPWSSVVNLLMYALLAAVIGMAIYLLLRSARRGASKTVVAEALPAAAPDLESEDVTADQLPSDGWMAKARELMEQGQWRLALRALYLSSLAHLAQQEFITIAKYKSNHDYARELRRRRRTDAEMLAAFGKNLTLFEDGWYGMHEVTRDSVERFNANLTKIRNDVTRQ